MKTQATDSVKLGMFVLTGIVVLILTLYMIGKNRGMFTDSFELKTHFRAVNGLISGNNVRYAGIEIGAVESVVFLNDTTIEVNMNIQTKMRNIIRRNAVASLGTDGLIGNRVVNIFPGLGDAPLANVGDVLPSQEEVSTDAMLRTLTHTNDNIAAIAEDLRLTVHHVSTSAQLTRLLDDLSLSNELKASLQHLHETTEQSAALMSDLTQTFAKATKNEGTLATLFTDTTIAGQLKQTLENIQTIEGNAGRLVQNLNQTISSIDKDLNQNKGTLGLLLKDTTLSNSLRHTLNNVEESTDALKLNMEALKHNFLFRGYFKKMEKQKKQ
ncbi:MAG: MlaD family protein [Haliscomenobacter sp.]|uniref:MlaD family protein n=1 Tax=Haliscomenobacter sp. TaxID=2717303 RepID=UPI0029AEE083|nr:MlaD family protein [Haliscomenobacter sp.]MDX2071229.1 MlaD family protein [Haliscomenobacter sp.]